MIFIPDPIPQQKRSRRRGDPVSRVPLTPDQATAALLKVKLSDIKTLEEQEKHLKGKN
jgi:hypothetical protein